MATSKLAAKVSDSTSVLSAPVPAAGALSAEELERQTSELAGFRRMLFASEGTFSLSFAVCTNLTLRLGLVKELCREYPTIAVVALTEDTTDIYDTVRQQIDRGGVNAPAQTPAAIFVTDVEPLLPAEAADQPVLTALNLSRERWEQFQCPVVFWMSEYAAILIATKAADLWRYRSHHFEFVSAAATVAAGQSESFPGYDMIAGLPVEQKRFRMAELEQRLTDVGDDPSPVLKPHFVAWSEELAELCQVFGQYDRSETLKRRVLDLEEEHYGSDHPHVATALNNLAALLQATNRLTEAESLMRRALSIDEQSFGPDHPVARDLNNLALLLKTTNRLTEAEPLMRRALSIDAQSFGPDHPHVAAALNNLALLLKATNRLPEAEPLYRRALTIAGQSFGRDHPDVATALNNLARLLVDTNRLLEAEPLARRVVEIFKAFGEATGHEHPHLQAALEHYELLKAAIAEAAE